MTPEIAARFDEMAAAYNQSLVLEGTLLIGGLIAVALVLCLTGFVLLFTGRDGGAKWALGLFGASVLFLVPAGFLAYSAHEQQQAHRAVAESHCGAVLGGIETANIITLPDDMESFLVELCGEAQYRAVLAPSAN